MSHFISFIIFFDNSCRYSNSIWVFSNPELVKAVEKLLNDKGTTTEANQPVQQDTPTGDLFGQDLVEDAIDRIANKIGSKKNLTEQERTSLAKDVTDLAKGIIQMGKATLDNVIDKIKEAIKKRFPDLDENDLNDISENIKQKYYLTKHFSGIKTTITHTRKQRKN